MFSWTKFFTFLARLGNTLLDLAEKANWRRTNAERQEEIDAIDDWVNDRLDDIDEPIVRLRAKIKDNDAS